MTKRGVYLGMRRVLLTEREKNGIICKKLRSEMEAMKKEKILWITQIAMLSLQLLASILVSIFVIRLHMLPGAYIAVLLLGLLLLVEGVFFFMFIKVKSQIALWRRIVSCALALVITCGCGVVSKLAVDAYGFFRSVTDDSTDAHNVYVLVLNDNPARTLADAKDYTYAAVENYDVDNTQKMVQAVEAETGKAIDITYYAQTTAMVDVFFHRQVDAVIMNSVSISLLIEQPEYQTLLTRVRSLYTLTIENESNADTNREGIANAPFIVYISGSDTRSQMLTVGRSDVNILAAVNPETKQVLLVNTPRDSYIPNPAGGGALDKLTHCGNYGVDCSIEALEGLYGISIDFYGRINFVGFEKLIDAIGGVTVYSEQSFTAGDAFQINKGENTLNGKQALAFARERYHVSGGDDTRGKHQMLVIQAVIDKLTNSTALISNYADILQSLEGMFSTNLTAEDIGNLVKMQLGDMTPWNVQTFAMTGTGDSQETYSIPGLSLSVKWPNQDSVAHASKLIGQVINGETLTSEDMVIPKA